MELIDDLYESAYVRAKDDPRLQSFLDQVEALRTYPLPYLANTTSLHLRDYFNENAMELELDELGHWVFHLRFYIHQHTHLIFNLYWREPSSTDQLLTIISAGHPLFPNFILINSKQALPRYSTFFKIRLMCSSAHSWNN